MFITRWQFPCLNFRAASALTAVLCLFGLLSSQSQAMDMINITTSTYQSKIHPNSKDVSLSNVSLILKGREIVIDGNITLNWGQRYGLLGANGEPAAPSPARACACHA